MKIYIYVCEETYAGLHGISDFNIIEVDKLDEKTGRIIDGYGVDTGLQLIADYCDDEYTLLREDYLDLDDDEFEAMQSDYYLENIIIESFAIRDEYSNLSVDELSELAYYNGHRDFVAEYCRRFTEEECYKIYDYLYMKGVKK